MPASSSASASGPGTPAVAAASGSALQTQGVASRPGREAASNKKKKDDDDEDEEVVVMPMVPYKAFWEREQHVVLAGGENVVVGVN